MTYLLAGLSYRRSPVAALERVALGAEELPVWLERLAVHAGGGVILSTCNRTEIYAWSDSTESPTRLIELLDDIASREGTKSPDFEDHVYSATGVDAARHLFRVASGLDSMATGEAQIAGQVRSALLAAGEAGGVAPRLSRLFHTALRTARRVRQATGVEKDSISIPSIGVQLLKLTLDELSGQSVLLIGAGETGTMTARALRRNGVRNLTVTSRRAHRAAELAAELGGSSVAFEERFDALKTADVVVACTAATEPIVDADGLNKAVAARRGRPLHVLDLGMPRDVAPEAADLDGVNIYTLDQLHTIANENRANRAAAIDEAEEMVDRELARFVERQVSPAAEPVVRHLGARAEQMRREELSKVVKRLPDLSTEQIEAMDAMTRALVRRLLADPITFLRTADHTDAAEAVLQIFSLYPDEDPD